LQNALFPDGKLECQSCQKPDFLELSPDEPLPVCPLQEASLADTQKFCIATTNRVYGYLIVVINDLAAFEIYRPYLLNFLNITATILENNYYREEMQRVNISLKENLENLELHVRQRTNELEEEINKRNILERELLMSQMQILESQQKLIQAQYISGIGDFTWDMETGSVYWSEGLYKLLKYTLDTKINIDFINQKIHHPKDTESVIAWINAGIKAQQKVLPPKEYRLVCQDGSVIFVETNARIEYKNGKASRLFGTCLDTTKQREAERSLKRYWRMVSATQDLVSLVDHNYIYRFVNNSYIRVLKKDHTEIIGHSMTEIFGKELFESFLKEKFDRCLDGETLSYQRWYDFPGIGHRFYDVVYSPYIGEADDITGVLISARDITSVKEAEQVVVEQERQFELVTKTIEDVIWMSTLGMEKILYVSPSFVNLWGRSPDAVYASSTHFIETIHPDYRTQYLNILETYHQQGKSYSCEYPILKPDGELRWIHERGSLALHPWQGHQVMAGICTDITERRRTLGELEKSEERWRTLSMNSPDYIMMLNLKHEITFINKKPIALSDEEVIGRSLPSFSPQSGDRIRALLDRVAATGKAESYETVYRDQEGRDEYFESRVVPILNRLNERNLLVTSTDISARKQSEAKQKLLASVFSHAREGIIITDATGAILDVNQAFSEMTGYGHDEVIGQNPRLLKSDVHDESFYREMWQQLLTEGAWKGEIWNRRKDGELYAEILTISRIQDEAGNVQHFIALFSDITVQKKHQQQLEHIAHYDTLTGLPNRLLFGDRLQRSMIAARDEGCHLGVVYLDLDGFKEVNDTYGHDVGDQLLMAVAKRMKQALRRHDTIARLGGDEFVAVLEDVGDRQTGELVFNRLLTAASEPLQIGELSIHVSASLGITFYPQAEPVDADQLLRQADQAMYQAKLSGKNNYYIFDTEQDRHLWGLHQSLGAIRQAIASQEFMLYYQPKVNMRTGEIVGAETLIRWQHPEEGLLPPHAFLPIIENHPLSIQLDQWVLANAIKQLAHWHSLGLKIPISVNISALQLQQDDFMAYLIALLAEYPELDPHYLELEVLETSAIEEITKVSQLMNECRHLGIIFAIDDFGTGYSSLTYLKYLPAEQIKIDQSFVYDMIKNPEDIAILHSILDLAKALRRTVIAEGVETLAHGQMLLKLGCELGQGYSIAKPMPPDQFWQWSQTWTPDPLWENEIIIQQSNFPLFLAIARENAFFQNLIECIQGRQTLPNHLIQQHQCSFCDWMTIQNQEHYNSPQNIDTLTQLHQQVHNLTQEILQAAQQDALTTAQTKLPKLQSLRLRLQQTLYANIQSRDLQHSQYHLEQSNLDNRNRNTNTPLLLN
jgi:diguanylate cyclase (GGDEF)-like protein/PAS domain S-box-containing protein